MQAIAVLRRYGQDAHIYLPGVGMLNGLQAANYIDSAGTTQGTVDQPVGLVLDAAGGLGVELVTNGGFDTDISGWNAVGPCTPSWVAGEMLLTSAAAGNVGANRAFSGLTVGKTYKAAAILRVGVGLSDIRLDIAGVAGAQVLTTSTSATELSFMFTATSTSHNVQIYGVASATGQTGRADNISVRELTGIHASQPTTASKPILRRGAVNLLTYSGDFSNAAWAAVGSANKTSASTFNFSANSASAVEQAPIISGGTASKTFTVAAWISCASGSVPFRLKNTHGAVLDNFSAELLATTTPQLFTFTVTNGAGVGSGAQNFGIVNSAVTPIFNTIISGGAALFQGTYTAQQIQALGGIPLTTTAPASTALGPQYWAFDGSNDSLSLGSVPFQMSDDICVIASASSTLASSERTVFSVTGAVANNPLCPSLVFGSDSRFKAYWRNDAGTLDQSGQTGVVQALGSMFVVSALKVGNSKTLRVNGALQSGAGGTNLGATTLTAANIGAFVNAAGASGGNLQGSTGPVIAIKGTVPDADLLLLERFVGQLSGVSI